MNSAPDTTLTLTRIRPNLQNRDARRDLAGPGSLHKTLMLLAPEGLGQHPRQAAGLLYRLEHATRSTPPTLLIQSHLPPDLARLPSHYGTAETRDLNPMLQALTAGRRVRYRITAAPSVRRWVDTGDPFFDPGRRHQEIPLHDDDALRWWQRKAANAGLKPHHTELTPQQPSHRPIVRQPEPGSERKPDVFRHNLTRFDGTAIITDPDQLRHAVTAGIGRGKPYGAGLLSLAPA
ncbi:type I-E CRISPR-associated protein Cas6/Cse3/CasE [Streptomyces sp. NPDC020951]|uniref:type I-E CRISPR-associated protein Cas6/Cse3/CasE n=1 Tax=Streptomyces sp. NPDC020951 TaxID=3365104 RepID=UPI00379AF14B